MRAILINNQSILTVISSFFVCDPAARDYPNFDTINSTSTKMACPVQSSLLECMRGFHHMPSRLMTFDVVNIKLID
jgi:hypothetical protein